MGKEIIGKRIRLKIGGKPPKDDNSDTIIGEDTTVYVNEDEIGKYNNIIGEKIELIIGGKSMNKRDKELLAKILYEIKNVDPEKNSEDFYIEGYDFSEINRILELAYDEGLFKGIDAHSKDGKNWISMNLKTEGYKIVEDYIFEKMIEVLNATQKDNIGLATILEYGNIVKLITISGQKPFEGKIYIEVFNDLVDKQLIENVKDQHYRITLKGKEFLKENIAKNDSQKIMKGSIMNQKIKNNTFNNLKSKDIWTAIDVDFGINKYSFSRKINFINIEFKKKVIFRDVEQAYILTKRGFSKPALILAGSVIEELLRLYLISKNKKPLKNTFDNYIKTCDKHGLLKTSISHLTNSVRHFRNIVHLENEKNKKYSISKATAYGAVSSIFTISNDF